MQLENLVLWPPGRSGYNHRDFVNLYFCSTGDFQRLFEDELAYLSGVQVVKCPQKINNEKIKNRCRRWKKNQLIYNCTVSELDVFMKQEKSNKELKGASFFSWSIHHVSHFQFRALWQSLCCCRNIIMFLSGYSFFVFLQMHLKEMKTFCAFETGWSLQSA